MIMKRSYLIYSWNLLLFYNYCVILSKCLMQLVGCIYMKNSTFLYSCWMSKFLGIQCLDTWNRTIIHQTTKCFLVETKTIYDIFCFVLLIFQKRIFLSRNFCFVILDKQVSREFASRGGFLITHRMNTILLFEKEKDDELLTRIKKNIAVIEQQHLNYGRAVLNEHYLIVRSGDYFLFESSHGQLREETDIALSIFDNSSDTRDLSRLQRSTAVGSIISKMSINKSLYKQIQFNTSHAVRQTKAEKNKVTAKRSSSSSSSTYFTPLNLGEKSFIIPLKPRGPESRQRYKELQSLRVSSFEELLNIDMNDSKEDELQKKNSFCSLLRRLYKSSYNLFRKSVTMLTTKLNYFTKDIRYVRTILNSEKQIIKQRIINTAYGDWINSKTDSFHVMTNQGEQALKIMITIKAMTGITNDTWRNKYRFTLLDSIQLRIYGRVDDDNSSDINQIGFTGVNNNAIFNDEVNRQKQFIKKVPRLFLLLLALSNCVLIYSEMLCFTVMLINQMVSCNLMTLVYPLSIFLWAMLCIPRPPTIFWVFIITYTQLTIIVKYIFRFKIIELDKNTSVYDRESPFFVPVMLGITSNVIFVDLLQLLLLFMHRDYLKSHGLWEAIEVQISLLETDGVSSNIFTRIFNSIKEFFISLGNQNHNKRVNVYKYTFACEFISFFIIFFGYNSFGLTNEAGKTAIDFIRANKVPIQFAAMLIVQFFFILIDRVLFLRKEIMGKFLFLIFHVLLIHVWLFFLIPHITGEKFNKALAPQILYCLKCLYFALTAYQIKSGYPLRILGNFLTNNHNYVNLFLFKAYLMVPFLYELRNIMDWMWTDTTLSLFHWMEVEDVFTKIFTLKCWRRAEIEYPTPRGALPWYVTKMFVGYSLMLVFVVCLWGPLLISSILSSYQTTNRPISCQLQFQINGYLPFYHFNAEHSSLSNFTEEQMKILQKCYNKKLVTLKFINYFEATDITIMRVFHASDNQWIINKPTMKKLIATLEDSNNENILKSIITCNREDEYVSNYNVKVSHTHSVTMTKSQTRTFIKILEGSNEEVLLVNVISKYFVAYRDVMLVSQYFDSNQDTSNISLYFSLQHDGSTMWWKLRLHNDTNCISQPTTYGTTTPDLYIFNEKRTDSFFGQIFNKYGILGIYAAYIFVAHRLLRAIYFDISYIIPHTELPNVDRILTVLNEIYLVRENKMFILEEQLVAKLIFLFRSSETLIMYTRHSRSVIQQFMDR